MREATPAERRRLDNLRLVAGVLAGAPPREQSTAGVSATGSRLPAGVFARRAVQALIAFAALEVAASLTLGLWGWDDFRREYGGLALFLATLVVAHTVTACLFLFAGRRDQRTWLLGVYFLLKATLVNPFALLAFLRGEPPAFGYPDFGFPYVYPFMFAPAFLWAFARECPRVYRGTRLDGLARRMVPASVLIGYLIWVGSVTWLELARAGRVSLAVSWVVFDGVFASVELLALAAVVVVVLRAHTAPAEEARRVALFSIGFLMVLGLAVAYDVVEAFSPGDWMSNYQWSPTIAVVELLRFPGILLLWYSVLAVRVPHLREVVRGSCGRLLARGWLLGVGTAVPAVVLGWRLASRPEQTVGAVAGDPMVQSLAAATAVLLVVAAARGRLLWSASTGGSIPRPPTNGRPWPTRPPRWPRWGGSRRSAAPCAGRPSAAAAPPSPCWAGATRRRKAQDLTAPGGEMPPLARSSAIVHMLETAGGPLRVHPQDKASDFDLLPHDDARWGRRIGRRRHRGGPGFGRGAVRGSGGGRALRRPDRAAGRHPVSRGSGGGGGAGGGARASAARRGAGSTEAPAAAQECPVCGCVTEAGEPAECDCGSAHVEMEAPKLLAGKFRLTRRLGSGGMGAVYLARDLRLERDVAIKTLTGVSVFRLMKSKPEAWAMATVTHPAVAQIYGIESWRSRPFLVVEFLPRGTLADRLRRGPVPAARAVRLTALLTDALEALHEAGYLHGDIKPGNVGFASDGWPKLLDFGLVRETNDITSAGGTERYLSPEVLSGRAADEADDVWSLCVMLYEMVSGEHPFAGGGADGIRDRIRRQRVRRGTPSPSAAVAFATSVLTARRSTRPATARAFADRLHGVSRITSVPHFQDHASDNWEPEGAGSDGVVNRSWSGRRSNMLSWSTCSIW